MACAMRLFANAMPGGELPEGQLALVEMRQQS
jgi:hypothetical protein